MIDLVSENSDSSSDELAALRSVLLAPDRELIERQRSEISALQERVDDLEELIRKAASAEGVDEVLVEAIRKSKRPTGDLGTAIEPELRHAFHISARSHRTEMAEAIYPLIGPAVRKMVAAMFSLDKDNAGRSFRVEQILLIDRETGLMIASTATEQRAIEDADVVSGMLDAVASFVQDAFEAPAGESLEDLRVGDLSVLVENGPRAALASVVRGAPTPEYRAAAAMALEDIHCDYAIQLATFDGSVEQFDGIPDLLAGLHNGASASDSGNDSAGALLILLIASVMCILLVSLGVFIGR